MTINKQLHQLYTKFLTRYAILAGFAAMLIVITSFSSVNAAPGNMLAPFDLGTEWNVCQGYDNTRGTHTGTSKLSLDLTGSGCDSSVSGKPVRSPLNGTVSWYAPSSGSLCVSALDGRSIMMTHIDSAIAQYSQVQPGEVIGTVAAQGQRQNNGVSHLHLQAWSSTACSNSNNQVPFDSAFGMRICGAPDLPAIGPNTFNNGIWGSTKFKGEACDSTPPSSPAVYRLYNTATQRHLYTTDVNEVNVLRTNRTWNYEGSAYWVESKSGCSANENVYRFYSERLQVHLYTTDENEKNVLMGYPQDAWRYEGVAFCAKLASAADNRPVYRFYSEELKVHLFTSDNNEKIELEKYPPNLWRYEGVAYYAY